MGLRRKTTMTTTAAGQASDCTSDAIKASQFTGQTYRCGATEQPYDFEPT
jgi:hypothetical protein